MFIAYIYNRTWTLIAQIEDFTNLEIKQKLSDSSSASFTAFPDSYFVNSDVLKKMNWIVISQQIWDVETELFRWVIRWFEITLNEIKIMCNDKIRLLEKRIIHQDYDISNQTIQTVLNNFWNALNQISSIPLNFECYASEKITKKFNSKTSFYSILKDFVWMWYEFRLVWDTLIFWKSVWRDRTTWDLFKEYSYDIETPDWNNIIAAKMTDDSKDITNWIVDENNNFNQNSSSVSTYWLLEDWVRLDWQSATNYLNETKDWKKTYDIECKAETFFDVEIWDVVKVYINRKNELLNFDWSMEVVEKSYQWWDLAKITYKFSTEKNYDSDFFSKLKEMNDKIKALQIKTWLK